nr:MAG TPA: hypothetical protein [Caudoviricetes sp.]
MDLLLLSSCRTERTSILVFILLLALSLIIVVIMVLSIVILLKLKTISINSQCFRMDTVYSQRLPIRVHIWFLVV